MSPRIIVLFLCTGLLVACGSNPTGRQTADIELGPKVDEVLNQIQLALVSVQKYPDVKSKLPGLSSVELELKTGFDENGKMKLTLLPLSGELGHTESASQTIKLTMKPPKADPDETTKITKESLSAQLEKLILASAEGVANASTREPRLQTDNLVVTLVFGLKRTAGGGVEFEIAPIKIGATAGVSSSYAQTIKLVFK